jgi:uncharacterized protein
MNDAAPSTAARPRYGSLPLPPYSYVPGVTPHPVSDPRGHMFGQAHVSTAPLDVDAWRSSPMYLHAVDLFNHGYYWEAHEAWESLWHAAGRTGTAATWLKALIKLAAAGVKAREGRAAGVQRHARRGLELLAQVRSALPPSQTAYCGLELARLESIGQSLLADVERRFAQPQARLVLSEWLELDDG